MQITKKIIAPLIIMILLAGTAGIMSAQELAHRQLQRTQQINQAAHEEDSQVTTVDLQAENSD